MYIRLGDELEYHSSNARRRTDKERAEIEARLRAKFGEKDMHIEKPRFCKNCNQYQALSDSEYCRRCIQTIANTKQPVIFRYWIWIVIALAVIGIGFLLLAEYLNTHRA